MYSFRLITSCINIYHKNALFSIYFFDVFNNYMNFATIDIIETTDYNLYVLEINSGIGATIFTEKVEGANEIMKEIYRHALDKLFQ